MPRNNVRADARFQKAVEYQIKNPNLTVCDAMKLADFSLREREEKSKYMMVLRLLNKTKKDDNVTPPAQLITTVSRSISEPITMSSADSSLVTSKEGRERSFNCNCYADASYCSFRKKERIRHCLQTCDNCVSAGEREG